MLKTCLIATSTVFFGCWELNKIIFQLMWYYLNLNYLSIFYIKIISFFLSIGLRPILRPNISVFVCITLVDRASTEVFQTWIFEFSWTAFWSWLYKNLTNISCFNIKFVNIKNLTSSNDSLSPAFLSWSSCLVRSSSCHDPRGATCFVERMRG